MTNQDFTTTVSVDQSPEDVFGAITNVRGWWSENIEGPTDRLGAEFTYHHQDLHRSRMKIVELVPGRRVAWLVLDNSFKFIKEQTEWTGTTIVFDISTTDGQTQLRFTHEGLVPDYECFDICSTAWASYINNSLRALIQTGTGHPNPKEAAA